MWGRFMWWSHICVECKTIKTGEAVLRTNQCSRNFNSIYLHTLHADLFTIFIWRFFFSSIFFHFSIAVWSTGHQTTRRTDTTNNVPNPFPTSEERTSRSDFVNFVKDLCLCSPFLRDAPRSAGFRFVFLYLNWKPNRRGSGNGLHCNSQLNYERDKRTRKTNNFLIRKLLSLGSFYKSVWVCPGWSVKERERENSNTARTSLIDAKQSIDQRFVK